MLFVPIVIVSTVVYAGSKAFLLIKLSERRKRHKKKTVSAKMKKTDQTLIVASTSVSLASTGILLQMPLVGIASVPIVLYVFAPTFKEAWHKLGKERRINDQVLTATRVTVCVVMGYTFIAALDAVLHAFSQRQFVHAQEDFHHTLQETCGSTLQFPDEFHAMLKQAVLDPSQMQQLGERKGEQMAPWMLAAFVLTLPLMGVGRAAAFLTTTFGGHLRKLGPYTSQRLGCQAVQQGILITQAGTLELAMRVDTIIFDGRLFKEPMLRLRAGEVMQALRDRYSQDATPSSYPMTLQVLIDSDEETLGLTLVEEVGLDGYFSASPGQARADLIEQLQRNGRTVCYVGSGENDTAEMLAALLSVTRSALSMGDPTQAGAILLGNGLHQLPVVFDLAAAFAAKQNFNFIAPIGVDLVDISTTVFLDFGLIYSVMFTYTGLLLGAANTHRSKNGGTSQEQGMTPAALSIVSNSVASGL